MVEIIMPKMGDGMEEGTLIEWLKKEGESVKSGEVIGTIQTDKATVELESPSSGTLAGLLIRGGETVPVGVPIGALLRGEEKLPSGWGKSSMGGDSKAPVDEETEPQAQRIEAVTDHASTPAPAESHADEEARVKASPLAKKLASEAGIDIKMVRGSGPGGRIVQRDVREFKGSTQPHDTADRGAIRGSQKVELNRLRKLTAERTTKSKAEVPHFYVSLEVDCEPIEALRNELKKQGAPKASLNDFIVKAAAKALLEMPVVNSEFAGSHVNQNEHINIGVAIAVEDGLTIGVIRDADRLSPFEIGKRSSELGSKASENKLSPDDMSGSTFAISNMGMLNVDSFSAIIVQPNAAMLAVGSAKRRPVVSADGSLGVGLTMNITCSFDHRVVDGAIGAKFINLIRDYLQAPMRLFS